MVVKKRVAVYIRVSTSDQKTDLQRQELQTYLKARAWAWDDYNFYEEKLTGTNTNRPEFKRLIQDAKNGLINVVLCWKLDRFSRSLKDLINNLQILTEHQVEFISLKDQIDLGTSAGRLMLHIIGAFGQFEADIIRERVKSGLASAKQNGVILGRPQNINISHVHKLRNMGLSLSRIAKELGVSKTAVHNNLKKSRVENK